MMAHPYRKFDGLSYRDVLARLKRQQLPEEIIEQTIHTLRAYRKERGDNRRATLVRRRAWAEVISVLQHERRIVRSMRKYTTREASPQRTEFIDAYMAVLDRLHGKLTLEHRQATHAPPHDHWVDYVPDHIKTAITHAAAGIPRTAHAKTKEPFTRTTPTKLNQRRKDRLYRRCLTERNTLLDKLAIDPHDDETKKKVSAITQALERLKEMEPTDHVPNHWAGLLE